MVSPIAIAKPFAAVAVLISVTITTTTTALSASPAVSRRTFVSASAAGVTSAGLLSSSSSDNGVAVAAGIPSVYEGMAAFGSNKVEDSVAIYDSIIRDDPRRKPYLWQRGLSLYYAGRYSEGADQFATDVAVNPNDTEEQIWHLLCLAANEGGSLEAARTEKLTVGKDRRPVMKVVQKLFLGGDGMNGAETELISMAENSFNAGDRFYASLYLSLYYESLKDATASQKWMTRAVGTEYATSVGRRDPMVDVARVAMKRRGWE